MSEPLRPLFLIKPKSMSRRDINRAETLTGVCIVECAEPEHARYSEAPLDQQLDLQARAALSLMRMVTRNTASTFYRADLQKWFIEMLMGERPMLVEVVPATKAAPKKS